MYTKSSLVEYQTLDKQELGATGASFTQNNVAVAVAANDIVVAVDIFL